MLDERIIRPEYLFQDMSLDDETAIADYRLWRMDIKGSTIFGEVMVPNGTFTKKRPLVIIFHGFPGGHRSEDIGAALRRIGAVTICPIHRGAWGSGGDFLVSNCVEDAIEIAKFYHEPENAEIYNIDPDLIFLAGHSMGGNTSINAAKSLPFIKGLILLAPGNMYRSMKLDPQAMDNLLHVGAPMLHCQGEEALKKDLEAHEDFDFINAYDAIKDMNICMCLGDKDPLDYGGTIAPLWDKLTSHETKAIQRQKTFHCGHGFCNARIATCAFIAEFMKDVCDC